MIPEARARERELRRQVAAENYHLKLPTKVVEELAAAGRGLGLQLGRFTLARRNINPDIKVGATITIPGWPGVSSRPACKVKSIERITAWDFYLRRETETFFHDLTLAAMSKRDQIILIRLEREMPANTIFGVAI